MHHFKLRRVTSLLLSLVLVVLLFSYDTGSEAAALNGLYFGVVNSTAYIRPQPSTASVLTGTGGKALTLSKGVVVTILEQVASKDASYPHEWYKVRYVYMPTGEELIGYVYSDNMTKRSAAIYTAADATFEASISAFPNSYKPYLRALHALYPNWSFTAYNTGVDFSTFVKTQAAVRAGTSESTSYSSLYHSRTNTAWRVGNDLVDGSSWYHASEGVVAYYLDPRNFLNEVDIMQFESLGYDAAKQTLSGVQKLLAGTFMDGKTLTDTSGASMTYAQAYMTAAQQSGVNPYSLAISTILENGTGGTKLTNGSTGYYNFYGIGSTPGGSPQDNGLEFAKTGGSWSAEMKAKCMIPWNTPYKAIAGGAIFMGSSYISIGQNTAYYKKFDAFSMKDGSTIHQYMQDIEYPVKEAFQAYNNYSSLGLLASDRNFIIPIYRNMPDEQPALPGTTALALEKQISGSAIISTAYRLAGGYITNIVPTTTAENFGIRLNLNAGASLSLSTDGIGTGTVATITYDGVSSNYTVVIRGDLNGDGAVSTVDLLYLRNYFLDTATLSDAQLIAADIDGADGLTMADLLKLRNYLLQVYEISQENIN